MTVGILVKYVTAPKMVRMAPLAINPATGVKQNIDGMNISNPRMNEAIEIL